MCLNRAQEQRHLLIDPKFNKGREIKDNLLKLANFKFLEWNLGISSIFPLNQFVMSVCSKDFRLSFNV